MSPTAPLFLAAALAAPSMAPEASESVARALIGHGVWLQSGNAFDADHGPRVMEIMTGERATPRRFGSTLTTGARSVSEPNTAPIRFLRAPQGR